MTNVEPDDTEVVPALHAIPSSVSALARALEFHRRRQTIACKQALRERFGARPRSLAYDWEH